MSKKRKRISRRRLAGQRVLAHVPTFHLETGEHKPVTAARRYLAEGGITPPALLRVRRNEQAPGATASAVHTQAADAGADNDARQLLVMMYVVAALIVALLVRKVMRNM